MFIEPVSFPHYCTSSDADHPKIQVPPLFLQLNRFDSIESHSESISPCRGGQGKSRRISLATLRWPGTSSDLPDALESDLNSSIIKKFTGNKFMKFFLFLQFFNGENGEDVEFHPCYHYSGNGQGKLGKLIAKAFVVFVMPALT